MGPRQVTANRTRLRQGGVSEAQADKGLRLIDKALADGPALRKDLKEKLESAGIPVAGQAMVHILYLASIRGLVVKRADGWWGAGVRAGSGLAWRKGRA